MGLTIEDQIALLEIERGMLKMKLKEFEDIQELSLLSLWYLTRLEIIMDQLEYLRTKNLPIEKKDNKKESSL